jgi:hypothetical protein
VLRRAFDKAVSPTVFRFQTQAESRQRTRWDPILEGRLGARALAIPHLPDQKNAPRLTRFRGHVRDLFSIWRPARKHLGIRAGCKLQALASIYAAAPQGTAGKAGIGDPPAAVAREGNKCGREASKEGNELFRLRVVADELSMALRTISKYFLAGGRDQRPLET